MNKKLQVFVSSTYTDLTEERQAAVQAILDAGHIPAGMELFRAGNQSQLNTIYKWIDESDVYMLILGGRYGSIEKESDLSYTQLEYEYAIKNHIPVFAVVLNQSFLTSKINVLGLNNVIEQLAPDKYEIFKSFVMSKMIKEVDDCKDIQLAIHSTLNDFMHDSNLSGWIRNTKKNVNELFIENKLLKENISQLQNQLAFHNKQLGRFTFSQLYSLLEKKKFQKTNALILFLSFFDLLSKGLDMDNINDVDDLNALFIYFNVCPYYHTLGLVDKTESEHFNDFYKLSTEGFVFYSLIDSYPAK